MDVEVLLPGGVLDGVRYLSVDADVPGGGHDAQHLRPHRGVLRHRRLVKLPHELRRVVIDVWYHTHKDTLNI